MNYKIIDGHIDTLLKIIDDNDFDFKEKNSKAHVDLPRLIKGQIGIVIFAICIIEDSDLTSRLNQTIRYIKQFKKFIVLNPKLMLIKNFNDIN